MGGVQSIRSTRDNSLSRTILVTGGTGFIGSHTCICLQDAGYEVIVLDNLCNSKASVIDRIGRISGRSPKFIEGDIRDDAILKDVFSSHTISAVMHFAGLKAVGDSVKRPLLYFDNNVGGTISLLKAMQAAGLGTIVFSSSCTVYGDPASVPITENFPRSSTNPYGASKLMIENILADLYQAPKQADQPWSIARLRYFNPVGAHQSGLLGEDPTGVPDNLMPFISQTAAGLRDKVSVFGGDYDTDDGTGVRDYIHVLDLADGHVAALQQLQDHPQLLTVNLGTGHGVSVLQMIKSFEITNGCKVPYQIIERRPGDIARCWADTSLAGQLLNWKATRTLDDMCRDAWHWQCSHKD